MQKAILRSGADPTHLRKWKILSGWPNEELETVVFVNIFGSKDDAAPASQFQLGALILTNEDKVFHVGSQVSIDVLSPYSKAGQLKTEVDMLSGLGLKKIEVSRWYCVALTKDQHLYLWGQSATNIPDSAFIFYEVYSANYRCSGCQYRSTYYHPLYEFAGLKFNGACTNCKKFPPTYGVANSKNSKKVWKLVNFAEAAISCTKCHRPCTPCKIGEHEVNYCQPCKYLPEDVTNCVQPNSETTVEPRRMQFGESMKFIDVACGENFFVALNNKNGLILKGTIVDSKYQGFIYNPSHAIVKALSCGSDHVAVVSVQGDLYTCGRGDDGQLGYEWTTDMGHITLRKVSLDGKVLKVSCGDTSTVCLMADGSLMCFGSHMKMMSPDVLALNQTYDEYVSQPARIMLTEKFTEIVNSPFTNIYFAKADSLIFAWGRAFDESTQPELLFGEGNLLEALADFPTTLNFKAPCTQQSSFSPHLDAELYGKKFLSDLTLKLSDGDFPAHRLILHANSVYFRDTFGESDSDNVLDMTHYNPEAYKCLIKYFYQVPPTDLKANDLFDLYELANSYKEADIAQEVFTKLKANLNPETVRPLLHKAKEVNCSEFLEECNTFIKSPEFKHILAEKVSQSLNETLSLLEVLDNKK